MATAERAKAQAPPLLQTTLMKSTEVSTGTPPSTRPQTPSRQPSAERVPVAKDLAPAVKSGHQRFVLTDPVAFRYLEEDSSTLVLARRQKLTGYECYIVEQWTTSRTHPTFMITAYTGDASHEVMVGVLSVPTDESVWSPRLRVYFRALNQYHARRRDTPLGILMVTNLSGFPSSLTVIPVPDGDVKKHRFDFFVNEDLKRLGCSGRVGLNLSQPAIATVAKFHQLYRTSDKNDIYKSVLELVKLCQSALTLFDKLEIDYADGLLCDVTEKGINNWWVEMGTEHYNLEPHDGILGPTTVAALLGLLMGARNRLHAVNAPVTKDPFDVESMKRAIGGFQKQQHMPRTRRLDRRTLDRLHKATQKAAEKERWAVPKAVKSTVAELSGKGGEMMMEAVGRRDRAGIAEIETADMDRFVQLVYGDRAKWLWLGRPLKKSKLGSEDTEKALEEITSETGLNKGLIFKPDEHGGFTWTAGRKSTVDGTVTGKREQDKEYDAFNRPTPVDEDNDESDEGKLKMFKRATNLKDDAKSGLGKMRETIGLRGHKSKPSTDETSRVSPVEQGGVRRRPLLRRAHSSPISSPNSPKGQEQEMRQMPIVAEQSERLNVVLREDRLLASEDRPKSLVELQPDRMQSYCLPSSAFDDRRQHDSSTDSPADQQYSDKGNDTEQSRTATATASIAGSIYNGIDLNEALPTAPATNMDASSLLRRAHSYNHYVDVQLQPDPDQLYPRHLSFSLAEDSVLSWRTFTDDMSDPFYDEAQAQLASEELIAGKAKHLRSSISSLQVETTNWTTSQIRYLHTLVDEADRDQERINGLYEPLPQSVREMQLHCEAILRQEKERLEEGTKDIETIAAKLEYEIGGLRGKIEDVQVGRQDYEKGVKRIEERVTELEKEGEKQGWSCTLQ